MSTAGTLLAIAFLLYDEVYLSGMIIACGVLVLVLFFLKNLISSIHMRRDGMSRKEAEAEEFDATCDDPEEVLAYEFGLEPDYIFDLLLR